MGSSIAMVTSAMMMTSRVVAGGSGSASTDGEPFSAVAAVT